jgi:hypothetical protein
MDFSYDKKILTTQSEVKMSVADLRDVIQAISISDTAQRLKEIQVVLESIVRKNGLKNGALSVE